MKARALAAALALGLAACGQPPTVPDTVQQAAPRFEGGGMTFGGGTSRAPAPPDKTAEAVPADTTGSGFRGGGSYGSGH